MLRGSWWRQTGPDNYQQTAKGGVGLEQRLFSNSMSKPDRNGSAWLLSLVRQGVGRVMESRACWPIRSVSASLPTVTLYYVVIAHRDRPWS